MKSLSLVFLYYFTSLLFLFIQYLIYNQEVFIVYSIVFYIIGYLLKVHSIFIFRFNSIKWSIESNKNNIIEGKRLTNKIALIKWVKNSNNTTE